MDRVFDVPQDSQAKKIPLIREKAQKKKSDNAKGILIEEH